MPVTNVNIANSALTKLGERLISTLADNTSPAQACNERLEPCKRAVLQAHPWKFAKLRTTLTLSTVTNVVNNGSGLCRVTVATHGWSTGNKVSIAGVIGTSEANGARWVITVIDPNTFDLQSSTFVNAYISGGSAGLAPEYNWTFQFLLPALCLRLLDVNNDSQRWRREGRFILADEESLEIKYVADHTDYDTMDPLFHEALAAYLAWDICYRITQNRGLKNQLLEDYILIVKRARFVGATEEPSQQIGADDWLDARVAGAVQYVRDPQT